MASIDAGGPTGVFVNRHDQDLVLQPGEAAGFSTWTPHWMGPVGGPAELIAIFGPQGERVHLLETA